MQKWDGYVDKCQQTSHDRDELSRKYADRDRMQEVSRMTFTFKIECDCGSMMRYDRQFYVDRGIMRWTCWECGQAVHTTDLLETVIR